VHRPRFQPVSSLIELVFEELVGIRDALKTGKSKA
jgi:hypothetical protein